jgi:hypothetical protein
VVSQLLIPCNQLIAKGRRKKGGSMEPAFSQKVNLVGCHQPISKLDHCKSMHVSRDMCF